MAFRDRPTVRSALFIKLEIDRYFFPDGFIGPQTLTFSDNAFDYTLDGVDYTALGRLLSVTSSRNELTPTSDSVSVALSGIPNRSLTEILKSEIKSSSITISRVWFDVGGEFVADPDVTNPVGRWTGFVNNYNLMEEWDLNARSSFNKIQLECKSSVDLFAKKRGGRRTNGQSMRRFFPNDPSFDRVWALEGASTDFGKSS